jgi:hypothetical protein
MGHLERFLGRRAVIRGAGFGLVAGTLAEVLPSQGAVAAAGEGEEIWSSEYWARKGDIPLWMYRKRLGAPKPAMLPMVKGWRSPVFRRAYEAKPAA